MPLVRISMWPGRTHEQKAELAKVITETISTITQAPPDATTILFEDIDKTNWAKGGILYSDT
ncbi:MAG: tautomerase family protein [Anaerolineales bacterium]|jgi:4-oxalocrotonate tautomerase|nr:tautomerase family protein [Anaerolineales bacterium]